MTTLFLALTLPRWKINKGFTLAILSLLMRIIIVQKNSLFTGVEEPQRLMVLFFDWNLDNCWVHANFSPYRKDLEET